MKIEYKVISYIDQQGFFYNGRYNLVQYTEPKDISNRLVRAIQRQQKRIMKRNPTVMKLEESVAISDEKEALNP